MTYLDILHPRVSSGRFTARAHNDPEIGLWPTLSPRDTISAEVLDRCPDAISWSVNSVRGSFVAPITITFPSGDSVEFEPHVIDEVHVLETLDSVSFEAVPHATTLFVDLLAFLAEQRLA
jgi:hypothetical protein